MVDFCFSVGKNENVWNTGKIANEILFLEILKTRFTQLKMQGSMLQGLRQFPELENNPWVLCRHNTTPPLKSKMHC